MSGKDCPIIPIAPSFSQVLCVLHGSRKQHTSFFESYVTT